MLNKPNLGTMTMEELQNLEADITEEIHNRKKRIAKGYKDLVELVKFKYEEYNKIVAIKEFRTLTGEGLRVAKDTVEALALAYGWVLGHKSIVITPRNLALKEEE